MNLALKGLFGLTALATLTGPAFAQEPEACRTVTFSDVGWTDITATTGVATAVLEQNREAAFYALMLDPLTAAVNSPAEIRSMFDEMAAIQAAYLPEWMN